MRSSRTSTGDPMSKLKIVHNLDGMSKQEIDQYLRDISEHLGVDPDLNAFDTIWMNSDDGMKRPQVYARRGTTDMLRDKWGIDIIAMDLIDVPGTVTFRATGHRETRPGGPGPSRQEIAVGSYATAGLTGQKLAD